jgi:hypothetical protein
VQGVVRLSLLSTTVDALEAAEDIIARLRFSILVCRRLDFDLWRFRIRKDAVDSTWPFGGALGQGVGQSGMEVPKDPYRDPLDISALVQRHDKDFCCRIALGGLKSNACTFVRVNWLVYRWRAALMLLISEGDSVSCTSRALPPLVLAVLNRD